MDIASGIRTDNPRVEREKLVATRINTQYLGRKGRALWRRKTKIQWQGRNRRQERGRSPASRKEGVAWGGHCAGLLRLRKCNGHLVVGRRHHQERKDTNEGAGAVYTAGGGRLDIAETGRERNSICRGEGGGGAQTTMALDGSHATGTRKWKTT